MYGYNGLMGFGALILIFGGGYLFSAAIFTAWIASQKKRSVGAWFFLGLFFGFLALLAVGFAPALEILSVGADEKNSTGRGDGWRCKKCGTVNPLSAAKCTNCKSDFDPRYMN